MLKMINISEVLLYKITNNWSENQILIQTGVSRTTIRKYKNLFVEYKAHYLKDHPLAKDIAESQIMEDFAFSISFKKPAVKSPVMAGPILKSIDNYISKNIAQKTTGILKQCMLKENIYKALLREGYKVSYSAVCKYITKTYGKNIVECYIKQHYKLGYTAEFDWGDVQLYIDGKLRRLRLGVFAMAGSNTRWGHLYQHENTLSFQEAHVEFFKYMNGVPFEVVYDNMKVAAIIKSLNKKNPTEGLISLMNHYHFKHRFCNICRGNEKGHVERTVEFLRRKAFCEQINFSSIEEANKYLEAIFMKLNNTDKNKKLLEEERQSMMSFKYDYQCSVFETAKIDKLSTFCYQGSHYSVPDYLIGKTVDLRAYSDLIKIYYNKKEVCRHDRNYDSVWVMKLDHYLMTLTKKPGALNRSEALRQVPAKLKEIYDEYFKEKPKDFISMLVSIKEQGLFYDRIYTAVNQLKSKNINTIDAHIINTYITNALDHPERYGVNKNLVQDKSVDDAEIELATQHNIMQLSAIMNLAN